jgi:DNA-binding NarL/FixJ family response regulator
VWPIIERDIQSKRLTQIQPKIRTLQCSLPLFSTLSNRQPRPLRARGYILKSAKRDELLHAIREVCDGRRYLDAAVASLLAERMSHRSLTSRELEVLQMVVRGLGNKEIASALNIAEVTVKLHVSHVLEKLNVKDRTQDATAALQRGIVSLG